MGRGKRGDERCASFIDGFLTDLLDFMSVDC